MRGLRGLRAVFQRELAERRRLFLVALGLGLLPLAVPLLPGPASGVPPSELRASTALALGLSLSLGLALALGGSIVGRDLAERRLGFYFSRPLSGWAVWAGKLGAALALALTSAFLVVLPSAAVDRGLSAEALGGGLGGLVVAAWLALLLFLVFLGHAGGVALRSRSPWLALDVLGLAVVGGLGWSAGRRLSGAGAIGALEVLLSVLLVLALLALGAAGAVQVVHGRTDARRGHRLLSLTLWSALLAVAIAAQGWTSWILSAAPSDLEAVDVSNAAPAGPWVVLYGPAAGRFGFAPAFLMDVESGRSVSVPQPMGRYWSGVRFSQDGRWAVWPEPQEGRAAGPYELVRLDLGASSSRPQRTGMVYASNPGLVTLSADGRRAAVVSGGRLTLEEIPSGRLLASADLPRPRSVDSWGDVLRFVAPDRVRLYGYDLFSPAAVPGDPQAYEIGELAVGGRLVRTGRLEQVSDARVDRESSRILAYRRHDRRPVLYDGATGAVLGELPESPTPTAAYFLADGTIAFTSGWGEREVSLFSPRLEPLRSFDFGGPSVVMLGGQPAPGQLFVETVPGRPGAALWSTGRLLLVDVATGRARTVGRGLEPLVPGLGPESAGSRLFLTRDRRLVELDPATGRTRTVAGGARR